MSMRERRDVARAAEDIAEREREPERLVPVLYEDLRRLHTHYLEAAPLAGNPAALDNRLRQPPPSPVAQHAQQRIILDRPSWSRQPDDGILLHGVSSQR